MAPAPADRTTADAALDAVGLPPLGAGEPLPAVLLPVWSRPPADGGDLPLRLHFDLKARFDLPEGLMTACATTYLAPVEHGDQLRTVQVLRSVGEPRTTRLGTGRTWVIDVEHRNQRGALTGVESWTAFGYLPAPAPDRGRSAPQPSRAGSTAPALEIELGVDDVVRVSRAVRELRPVHLDRDAARAAGLPDVILGTTGQQLWLWRALAAAGVDSTLGRLDLRMRAPVGPGRVAITAEPAADEQVSLAIRCGDAVATTAAARLTPVA